MAEKIDNTEAILYQLLRHSLPDLDFQRIETEMGGGVPDTSYTQGMCELKKTLGWQLKFRPHQPAWIARRARRGGRVRIVTRQTGMDRDVLWIHAGSSVLLLEEHGLGSKLVPCLGAWRGGPRSWDWDAVRAAMISEVM